jgi:hypothetical protein
MMCPGDRIRNQHIFQQTLFYICAFLLLYVWRAESRFKIIVSSHSRSELAIELNFRISAKHRMVTTLLNDIRFLAISNLF